MATINFDSELRRAGAEATHGWRRLAFLARRYLLGTVGLVIMVLFVAMALSADLICRYDPLSVDSAHRLAAPNAQHWFGTDPFGRDVWSRIVHGARISLAVGIGSTLLGSSIGVIVGLASGYLSGWVDLLFQRVTDIMQSLPLLVLGTARPEVRNKFPALWAERGVLDVHLSGLGSKARERLVQQVLGSGSDAVTRQRIIAQAGGNPLFLDAQYINPPHDCIHCR